MSKEKLEKEAALDLLHARRESAEVQAMLAWSRSILEAAKEQLISADAAAVPGLQARAKLMRELQNGIKTGPIRGPQTPRG